MSALTCPGCEALLHPSFRWCPFCGKWLRLIGPTASEMYHRRKDFLYAAQLREDSHPTKGTEA